MSYQSDWSWKPKKSDKKAINRAEKLFREERKQRSDGVTRVISRRVVE